MFYRLHAVPYAFKSHLREISVRTGTVHTGKKTSQSSSGSGEVAEPMLKTGTK